MRTTYSTRHLTSIQNSRGRTRSRKRSSRHSDTNFSIEYPLPDHYKDRDDMLVMCRPNVHHAVDGLEPVWLPDTHPYRSC